VLPQPLPEGVRRDQALELTGDQGVPAEGELGLRPQLEGAGPQVFEPSPLRVDQVALDLVAEGCARPDPVGLVAAVQRVGRPPGVDRDVRGVDQAAEDLGIDPTGLGEQCVARARADQQLRSCTRCPVGLEQAAQPGDRHLQRGGCAVGRRGAPDVVDQPVHRHHVSSGGQQQGQDRTLPAAGDRHVDSVHRDGDATEHREADVRHVRRLSAARDARGRNVAVSRR
jgi:hypothetical protein